MTEQTLEDRWITYVDNTCKFKTHTISSKIAGKFLANLMSQGMEPGEGEDKNSTQFETNGGYGSIITAVPKMSFQIGDKALVLSVDKVAETGSSLLTNKEKGLPSGEKYHALYSRFHVLILTSEEVKLLLPLLDAKLEEARETYESFMVQFNKSWGEGAKGTKRSTAQNSLMCLYQ